MEAVASYSIKIPTSVKMIVSGKAVAKLKQLKELCVYARKSDISYIDLGQLKIFRWCVISK